MVCGSTLTTFLKSLDQLQRRLCLESEADVELLKDSRDELHWLPSPCPEEDESSGPAGGSDLCRLHQSEPRKKL